MIRVVRLGSRFTWLIGLWFWSVLAYTHTAPTDLPEGASAYDTVRSVTERVMELVDEAKDYAEDDPNRYYTAIDEAVGEVIDYRGFARRVMGPYASGDRYRSLDQAGRQKLRGQLERFTAVLRTNLVTTYSKGLMAFSGSRIELSNPSEEDIGKTIISVKQLIYNDESKPYVLSYQMGLDKQKEWKLRNLIIDSVNLGEIYKNQFQAAARKYEGDLDSVIESWTVAEIASDSGSN